MNVSNMIQAPLKYGIHTGEDRPLSHFGMQLKASEVFSNKSGKFVGRSSNQAIVAVAGTTELVGFANTHAHTVSASVAEYAEIVCDFGAEFLLPSTDATWADTMRGKTCDLKVTANIQAADLDASATDVIVLTDGNATLSLVSCMLNPLKMFVTGVA